MKACCHTRLPLASLPQTQTRGDRAQLRQYLRTMTAAHRGLPSAIVLGLMYVELLPIIK